MKILIVSEGGRDIGHGYAAEGAVVVLARRVIEARLGRELHESEVDRGTLPRINSLSGAASGYERKVKLAIVEAQARGCSAVAIVVDRDGRKNKARIEQLCAGRELAASESIPLADKTVVAVAIETVEAWLIADIKAINDACRPQDPADECPNPEGIWGPKGTSKHPKDLFLSLIDTPQGRYEAVARRIRLDVLEKRCPDGFGRFAEELRRRCC